MKPDKWVKETILKMSLKEKVTMLSGKDSFNFAENKRLGIPSIGVTDGPNGVRCIRESGIWTATSFPTGVSMASSWDPELIEEVGKALAEETAAHNCSILLAPCMNIVRTPLAGRNFESFSEDPYLAGEIGVGYVSGMQKMGIGTSLKHFACNNQEIERHRGSSEVDERTLREIYLPAFETIVKRTQPWTVMTAYNKVNGVQASESKELITDILRNEWGFEGVCISDWGGTHTIFNSVKAGQDIEMPGPARYYGSLLEKAVTTWQIEEEVIDNAVERILKLIVKSGRLEKDYKFPGKLNTKEHQRLAGKAAEESIVLLKNNKLLPIIKNEINSVAVIGYNALEARIGGGGSSYLEPPKRVSPLNAIKAEVGEDVKIVYEAGCENFEEYLIIPCDHFSMPGTKTSGVKATYYDSLDFNGRILKTVDCSKVYLHWFDISGKDFAGSFSSVWETTFSLPVTGRYGLKIKFHGHFKLYINKKMVLEGKNIHKVFNTKKLVVTEPVFLEGKEGEKFDIVVEYVKDGTVELSWLELLGAYSPAMNIKQKIESAARAARESDVAIVFAGMPKGFETENADREHMDLPGDQNKLIEAVVKANKKTIVVLNTGSPVTMPWINKVDSVVQAYFPGQEGGTATSDILFGNVNPSGKLTVTYPQKYEDNPTYNNYPGDRKVFYGEGLYVGYRYYDTKNVTPLFPFGHGLSYTTFSYKNLEITKNEESYDYTVSLDITNTGSVKGKEVAQLYVQDIECSVHRPVKELKDFLKVLLEPGETKRISMSLNKRSFAFYSIEKGRWIVEPGDFKIMVGASSSNIISSKIISIDKELLS